MRSLGLTLAFALCFALTVFAADIEHCKTYNPDDDTKCTECDDGFGVDGFNTCTACSAGCTQCATNVQVCTHCQDKFFLDANVCTACGANCATCTDATTCATCILEHCTACSPTAVCSTCEAGFYFGDNACNECGENCAECTSPTECTKCNADWFVKAGTCVACDPNCDVCGVTGCTTCKASFYPDAASGLCDKCSDAIAHCSVCTDETHCTACDGPWFIDDNKCDACGKACGTCESAAECTTCRDKNCEHCTTTTCDTCAAGFYSNGEGDCILCGDGCETCTKAGECDKCEIGFFHLTDESVCVKCDDKCETCNEHGCGKCAEFYFADAATGLCSACGDDCRQCTSATACTLCKDDFFVNPAGSCKAQDPNCEKKGDHGCEQCKVGFYADKTTGLCPGCPSGCAKCNAAKTCDECASSFKSANGDGECTTKAWVIILSVVFGIALIGGIWKGYSVYSKKRASALNHELLRNTNDSR